MSVGESLRRLLPGPERARCTETAPVALTELASDSPLKGGLVGEVGDYIGGMVKAQSQDATNRAMYAALRQAEVQKKMEELARARVISGAMRAPYGLLPVTSDAKITEIRKTTTPERTQARYVIGGRAVEVWRCHDGGIDIRFMPSLEKAEGTVTVRPSDLAPLIRGITEILQREWDVTTEELMRDSTPTETDKVAA